MFYLKYKYKITEYHTHYGVIRWRISISINDTPEHFRQVSPYPRHSNSNIRYLEDIGQSHDLQHSMAFDSKFVTSYLTSIIMFALSLTVLERLVFQKFGIESLGQSCRVQHSAANTNLYNSHTADFYANSQSFGDIKV